MTVTMDQATQDAQPAAMPDSMSDGDYRTMYTALQHCDPVKTWMSHGNPARDVEMTLTNVMAPGCHRYRVAYTDSLKRMMAKHHLEERELVRRVLTKFAAPAGEQSADKPVQRR